MFCETAGFEPPVTGEEICSSIRPVSQYVEAIMPKGRNMWEIVLTSEEMATGLEVAGIKLRERSIEISHRFPGGTWVRVRGLPLETNDIKRRLIFEYFGSVVSGPHRVTWRGTNIKTGDRTLKIKLERNIPQSFMTMEGKTRVTRYRDQPKLVLGVGRSSSSDDTGGQREGSSWREGRETIFSCPHTFSTTSGMASDCVRCRGKV